MRPPTPALDSLSSGCKLNDYLLCVVDGPETTMAILDDLLYANLAPGSVMVFQPEAGESRTDDDGVLHTTAAMFRRLAGALGFARRDAEGYLKAIATGGTVIAAHAGNAVDQDNVLAIYRQHGGTCHGFWGRRLSWQPTWSRDGAA